MNRYRIKAMFLILSAVFLAVTLSSCGYFSQYSNRSNAESLRLGMTKEEVLKLMGEPLRNRHYHQPDIWFYYYETRWAWDCQSTRDECLPLVFKGGKLVGWGKDYYYRYVEVTGRTGQIKDALTSPDEKQK